MNIFLSFYYLNNHEYLLALTINIKKNKGKSKYKLLLYKKIKASEPKNDLDGEFVGDMSDVSGDLDNKVEDGDVFDPMVGNMNILSIEADANDKIRILFSKPKALKKVK